MCDACLCVYVHACAVCACKRTCVFILPLECGSWCLSAVWDPWLFSLWMLLLSLSLFSWDLKYKYDGPFAVDRVSSVLFIASSACSPVLVLSVCSVSEPFPLPSEFSVKPSMNV